MTKTKNTPAMDAAAAALEGETAERTVVTTVTVEDNTDGGDATEAPVTEEVFEIAAGVQVVHYT